MKDWIKLLTESSGDRLAGEAFVAACPLAGRGFIRSEGVNISNAISISVGRSVPPAAQEVGGERLPATMVFGLTETRLLVFELVTKTARPGELVAVLPLKTIEGVSATESRAFFVKQLNVDIALRDGNHMALEAGWPALAAGRRFVEALARAVAAAQVRSAGA